MQLNSNKGILYLKKMERCSEQTLFQRRHTDGQQVHTNMLNIINHKGNANQSHSKISPHTCQNDYYQNDKKQQALEKIQRKGNPVYFVVATMESSMQVT